MNILEQIVATKRLEVSRQKEVIPLSALQTMSGEGLDRNTLSMKQALATSQSGIIAEFKRRSPSKGWLYPGAQVADIIPDYEKGGASACSILTDGEYFGGSPGDLQKARKLATIPLLRKDFIIDAYQLFQARAMGADAILLIAACLSVDECRMLAETAHSLQLEVLLEIHNEKELEHLNPHIDMLGVNNRDLGSFHTNIENSFRLIEKIEVAMQKANRHPLLIAESGISTPAQVKELQKAGFQGFLIGETFMKSSNPGQTVSNFIAQLV